MGMTNPFTSARAKPSHWRERRAARVLQSEGTPDVTNEGAVHIHIEELVLRGVSRHDGRKIATAMKDELSRLAADQKIAPRGTQKLNAGKFAPGSTPETTGRAVGAAIHRGLRR
jgi:hypothetical protein